MWESEMAVVREIERRLVRCRRCGEWTDGYFPCGTCGQRDPVRGEIRVES